MKKLLIALSVLFAVSVANAADWWSMDTICQIDTNKCYESMGSGYDTEIWDADSSCWGMKMVCGNSLVGGSVYDDSQLYTKAKVLSEYNKNTDFDFANLNTIARCFGARKTKDNGTKAMVSGEYVNVYCNGVMGGGDEKIANGEIVLTNQPKCSELAMDGWVVALDSGKCYGKRYAAPDYFIDCGDDTKDLPSKIVKLNGARNYATGSVGSNVPTSSSAAQVVFDSMLETSRQKHIEKFGK